MKVGKILRDLLLPSISSMQFQCIIIDTKQFNLFSTGE